MKPFVLTNQAKADLRAIALFTEQSWGKEQRNLYVKQFDDAFHLLATSHLAGKDCSYLRAGYRKFPQGSHIIFYKTGTASVIEIIRILHKSMDVDSRLEP